MTEACPEVISVRLKSRTSWTYRKHAPLFASLCCRILSTGMTQRAISHSFGIAQPTVHKILVETTSAIFEALKKEFLPIPTEDVWKINAGMFEQKWNFPNCVGAIDGKHVQIQVKLVTMKSTK